MIFVIIIEVQVYDTKSYMVVDQEVRVRKFI